MDRGQVNLDLMASRQDFAERVEQLAQGTPYAVTPTPDGFDVAINFTLEEFYPLMAREKVAKTFTQHVKIDESSQTFSITDDSRTVSCQAGTDGYALRPVVSGSVERTLGRSIELSSERSFSWDEVGTRSAEIEYRFNSEEGRGLIKKVAAEQGWNEKMSGATKIGLYVGLGAIGMVVVMGLIALIIVFTR